MQTETRKAYNQFTINTLENYKRYQIHSDPNLKDGDHTLYWFTVKLTSPTGRWNHFQMDLKKYICPFYYDVCDNLLGKIWKRTNKKHLKPFFFAAPDYENSNYQGPSTVNTFNHIHGLMCIRNDQKGDFQKLLSNEEPHYKYSKNIMGIRKITINETTSNANNNLGYINYLNKNSCRSKDNNYNEIYLPADKKFFEFIAIKHKTIKKPSNKFFLD